MAGLREKQKANRRLLIEKAASDLFAKRGFVETTIEEIADAALVSAATVYNYYGTKGDLLLALVARGEEAIFDDAAGFLERADRARPVDLLVEVILSNVSDTLNTLSRELWAQVIAFVATTSDDEVGPRYIQMISEGLGAALEAVGSRLVEGGKLQKGLDTAHLSLMLTRLERIHFLNFVYIRDQSWDDMAEAIRADVELIISPFEA